MLCHSCSMLREFFDVGFGFLVGFSFLLNFYFLFAEFEFHT